MDPITQGTLGAAASLAVLGARSPLSLRSVALMGAAGGMAADLDVLIRSSDDPFLAILFHRHFTHSLAFVPVGGALVSLAWLARRRLREDWRWVLGATTTGYATHALLDACTTYGTLLLWPFSMERISWHAVSVVDPLYTLPMLVLVVLSVRRKAPRLATWGFLWGLVYLGFGFAQRERAASAQTELARRRGHVVERSLVLPMFANDVAWRSLYRSGATYHVDKIRVPWTGGACVTPGTSVPAEGPPPAGISPSAQRAHRLLRWFAGGWVARDPEDPTVLGDLRYSFAPTEAATIWGIRVDPSNGRGQWVNRRGRRGLFLGAWNSLVFEDGPGAQCW